MLEIEADSVGSHDFLLTPCSVDTFRHFYPDKPVHRGCFGNLAEALAPWGIEPDAIPTAFNCFMNVPVGTDGRIEVLPPESRAGDSITFRAAMDLVIRGEWHAARDRLQRLPDHEGPRRFLLHQMHVHHNLPPPNWDGAFALESK